MQLLAVLCYQFQYRRLQPIGRPCFPLLFCIQHSFWIFDQADDASLRTVHLPLCTEGHHGKLCSSLRLRACLQFASYSAQDLLSIIGNACKPCMSTNVETRMLESMSEVDLVVVQMLPLMPW